MRLGEHNRELAGLVAGFILWSVCFVVLYGIHGFACENPVRGAGTVRAVLVGAWVVLLAAHGALIWWFARRLRGAPEELRPVRLTSFILAVAALGASLWTGIPVATLSLC